MIDAYHIDAYHGAMASLMAGESLSRDAAAAVMRLLLAGDLKEVQAAALLSALAVKGESADEIAGMAAVMRDHATPLPGAEDAVDTCGTGGSGLSTANTSTMCAFVLASAGAKVVKHGNRSATGRCGSADVLEKLGARIDLGPEAAGRVLQQTGITALFAPTFHPAMRHMMPVRRQLGFRTVFNFLGPLCNPARVRRQVLGVCDPERAATMAHALAALGSERALVVHGTDDLDELTLCAASRIWVVSEGRVSEQGFEPEELGLQRQPFAAIAGGEPAENAALFEALLRGRESVARRQHLQLNAAAGLLVAGLSQDLAEGFELAGELLVSGAPWRRFEAWRDATWQGEVAP